MGGHLALRLAHRKICRVTALVLLSPMISLPVKPLWLGWLISRLAIACGQAQKPAAGQAPRQLDHVRQHKPNNVLTGMLTGMRKIFCGLTMNNHFAVAGPAGAGYLRAMHPVWEQQCHGAGWQQLTYLFWR